MGFLHKRLIEGVISRGTYGESKGSRTGQGVKGWADMEFQHKVSLSPVSQGILDCELFHEIPPRRQGAGLLNITSACYIS